MPEKLSVTSSITGFVTPWTVKSPATFPVFSPVRSNFVQSDFGVLGGIEKLIAFHMLVENGHKRFDAVRLEGHRELTFLGVSLIVKKFALIAGEVSALAADAEMVPAEPHLGVQGVERVSRRVRPSVQGRGEKS